MMIIKQDRADELVDQQLQLFVEQATKQIPDLQLDQELADAITSVEEECVRQLRSLLTIIIQSNNAVPY